jgi:hypothetical protein
MLGKYGRFFLRHTMTVAGAAVLGGFMVSGMLYPEMTLNSAKWGVFVIGGVMYALGWARGVLDAQQQAADAKRPTRCK